jgi:tRNA(Ile)-lysidine synthetase-like protein
VEHHPPSGLLFVVQRGEPQSYELGQGDAPLTLGPQRLEMKRARGKSLKDLLAALAADEPKVVFDGLTAGFSEPGTPGTRYDAVFSASTPQPLKLRTRRRGDRIKLPGGEGHAKLSDVFVNAKVPHSLRSHWPVVTGADGVILWLPGIMRSGAGLLSARARNAITLLWVIGA